MSDNYIYKTNLHWFSFIRSSILIIIGLLAIPKFIKFLHDIVNVEKPFTLINLLSLFLIYILYKGIKEFFFNKSIYIIIYPKRITITYGINNKTIQDIPLNKLEELNIQQSTIGKLFNYGHIYISSPKFSQDFIVKNPNQFRNFLHQQIDLS